MSHSLNNDITIKALCNLYLEHQNANVQSGQITVDRYRDQVKDIRMLVHFLGQYRLLSEISALDSQNYNQRDRLVFMVEQIKKLLDSADTQMKAMILLGLNCGFGCTDCAELEWKDLDINNGRVKLAWSKPALPGTCLCGWKR